MVRTGMSSDKFPRSQITRPSVSLRATWASLRLAQQTLRKRMEPLLQRRTGQNRWGSISQPACPGRLKLKHSEHMESE